MLEWSWELVRGGVTTEWFRRPGIEVSHSILEPYAADIRIWHIDGDSYKLKDLWSWHINDYGCYWSISAYRVLPLYINFCSKIRILYIRLNWVNVKGFVFITPTKRQHPMSRQKNALRIGRSRSQQGILEAFPRRAFRQWRLILQHGDRSAIWAATCIPHTLVFCNYVITV